MKSSRKTKKKVRKGTRGARLIDWVFEKGRTKEQLMELARFIKKRELQANLAAWKKRKLGRPSGVYVLYKRVGEDKGKRRGRAVYYVGKASQLPGRIRAHLRDQHCGKWQEFAAYGTDRPKAETLETLLIKVADPEGTDWKKKARFRGNPLDLRGEIRKYYIEKGREFG